VTMPGFTADASVTRGRIGRPQYRHPHPNPAMSGPETATRRAAFTAAQDGAPTCCDAVACVSCPAHQICAIVGGQARCLHLGAAPRTTEARFLPASLPQPTRGTPGHYPWPYHCTSGDGHAEIYCHTGCWSSDGGVGCIGPGPWGS
jgi:hypothetical protein